MKPITPESIASTKIAVTNTATLLYSLMDTAGSITTSNQYYNNKAANGVWVLPEDGDIRVSFGSTPTTTAGILISAGQSVYFPGVALETMKLIRTGGSNVAVSLQIFNSLGQESPSIGGGGGGGTPTNPSETNLIQIGSTDVNLDDAAFAVGVDAVLPCGFLADETAPDSVNEGDTGIARMTLDRKIHTSGNHADDAAFTPGTHYGNVIMGFADEAATDSVDEGDVGAVRMTLDRKIITAGSFKEDTAHTDADYGVHMLTVRDDTPVAKAGTDGDYQSLTTDDYGALWSRNRGYDPASDTQKISNLTPEWSHTLGETLATLTNITQNTTAYVYSGDMTGYRNWTIQGDTSGSTPTDVLTVTIEATTQDDGTAAASCFYTDVTRLGFDAATGARTTASWVDTDFGVHFVDMPIKYFRVKYVTSAGGGNDADLTVYTFKA